MAGCQLRCSVPISSNQLLHLTRLHGCLSFHAGLKLNSHVPPQVGGGDLKHIGGQMKDTPYMHERDQIGIKEINFRW